MTDEDRYKAFKTDEYLGDGVYASFDGYQIWLAVNDHRNRVIALEPQVFDALVRYRTALYLRLKEEQAKQDEPQKGKRLPSKS